MPMTPATTQALASAARVGDAYLSESDELLALRARAWTARPSQGSADEKDRADAGKDPIAEVSLRKGNDEGARREPETGQDGADADNPEQAVRVGGESLRSDHASST
jgi:hypothetical protein